MATYVSNGQDTGAINDSDTTYIPGNSYSVKHCNDQFATDGDTITLPAGTFTWATGVTITHSLTVAGSGYTPNTAINGSSPGAPALSTIISATTPSLGSALGSSPTSGTGSGLFRVTGLKFIGPLSTAASYNYLYINNSKSQDPIRIDNCYLDSGGTQTTMVILWNNGTGVFDHCTFNGGVASEMVHNNSMGVSLAGWTDDLVPGSKNMYFFEDNIFQLNNFSTATSQTGTSAFQTYYGARTVARYNLSNFCQFDCHGSNAPNTRWFEFYNNKLFIPSTNTGNTVFFVIRGGSGVIWNNSFASGSQTSLGAIISLYTDEASTNDLNPAVAGPQPGYGPGAGIFSGPSTSQGPTSSPVYLWNNDSRFNIGSNIGNGGWNPSPITPNSNYFISSSQPSSMTISQTAAQIGGTTYSYSPYTYPHPLTGIGGSVTPTLSGSIGVSGILSLTLNISALGSIAVSTILAPSFGVHWSGLTATTDTKLVRTIVGATGGYSPLPANIYAALFGTIFGNQIKSGALEWSDSAYVRQLIGATGAGWTIAAYANGTGVVWSNTNSVIFPAVIVTQTLASIGFCDAASVGNINFFVDLAATLSVPVGISVVLAVQGISFTTY